MFHSNKLFGNLNYSLILFRFRRKFSKRTKNWYHVPVLVPNQYTYTPQLMLKVFEKRMSSEGNIDQRIGLSSEDPRRIAPNIARYAWETVILNY